MGNCVLTDTKSRNGKASVRTLDVQLHAGGTFTAVLAIVGISVKVEVDLANVIPYPTHLPVAE